MRAWVVAGLLVLGSASGAAAQSADEVKQLKQEVAALKASVAALAKEVAVLKGGAPAAKKPNFAARLAAANSLTSVNESQDAYAKLCVEAARWGETKLVHEMIGRITSVNVSQDCLSKCALRLAAAGLEDDAVALAKRITSVNESQRVLGKIARGEFDEKP